MVISFIFHSYAESFEIWIDLDTNLPLIQKVFINDNLSSIMSLRTLLLIKFLMKMNF